jgi:hypothetical protein
MKHLIISLLSLGGVVALGTTEASALVCGAGLYRAGCVGGRGGRVVVRRPYVWTFRGHRTRPAGTIEPGKGTASPPRVRRGPAGCR